MYTIYALVDPRDSTVHYVGITEDVYKRFFDHIQCSGTNYEKNAWVTAMRAANVMVCMKTLETTEDIGHARVREVYWINHYQALKHPLTNIYTSEVKLHAKVLVREKFVRSPKAAIQAIEKALHPEQERIQHYTACTLPEDETQERELPELGENDKAFTPEQEEEFLTRYRRRQQPIKNILRQMNGGLGLSNRYAKHGNWLLEKHGLRKGN